MIARSVFVANMFDLLAENENISAEIAEWEYALLLGDSWMNLNDWQQSKLVMFNREVGLNTARNAGVKAICNDPDLLGLTNMPELIRFVLEVTIYGTQKDAGEQRINASSLSLDLIRVQAEALGQSSAIHVHVDAMTQQLLDKNEATYNFQRELADLAERNATAQRWKKEAEQRQRRTERKAKKEQAIKDRNRVRYEKLSDRQRKLLNMVSTFATDMIPAQVK